MEHNRTHRTGWIRYLLITLFVCVVSAGILHLRHTRFVSFPELPRESVYGTKLLGAASRSGYAPEARTNTWYSVTPVNGFSGNRTGWHGIFRKGTENKVIVYFFGGGVSLNEETDQNYQTFFTNSYGNQDYIATIGISSRDAENPFRDWTVIGIPYSTGDLHIGTGEYRWTDEEGTDREVCHYGFLNYDAVMDEAMRFVGEPEALLITGFSAGGFAAALLADDVMDRFPSASNVTVCCDSSVLLYDGWHKTAADLWKAPSKISHTIRTDNLILDALTSLKKARGDSVNILFDCSLRDSTLTIYQSYIDNGVFSASQSTKENGDVFQANLTKTVRDLQEAVPGCGIYIFENGADPDTHNTRHMIINSKEVYQPLCDDTSVMDWIKAAVQGQIESHGLELLEADPAAD